MRTVDKSEFCKRPQGHVGGCNIADEDREHRQCDKSELCKRPQGHAGLPWDTGAIGHYWPGLMLVTQNRLKT